MAPRSSLASTMRLQVELPHAVERCAGGTLSSQSLISIVDDDQPFRESMQRLTRSLGYTADVFSSAADFLASRRLGETACLITDIHMPGMTGVDLYRHLIETGHAIPTILVTAYPNEVERARALKDGVLCYLRKPVDEHSLCECLRAAMKNSETSGGTS
jgi:FixJ family two-component response regulator